MIYTDNYNLPEWLVRQLIPKDEHPPNPKRMSVTSLIHPPRMRTLLMEKWSEIMVDVSELLNFFDGNNLDAAFDNEENAQEKLNVEIDGITLVGKLDLHYPTSEGEIIVDNKRTKVGSLSYGDTVKEWERQLNCYSWMFTRITGRPVCGLENHVYYKDHSPVKAVNPTYPKIAFEILNQPLWKMEEAEDYIRTQLEYHALSPMACPVDERWGNFAVMSNGRKTAHRVLKTMRECEEWMQKNKKGDYIEHRDALRCRYFCPVKTVCKDSPCYLGEKNE
jgi:hypothetical protein